MSMETFAQGFALSPLAMCVTDNGLVAACNSELAQMLGCDPGEVLGRELANWYAQPSRQRHEHEPSTQERILRRACGLTFWCRVHARPAMGEWPSVRVIWAFQDLSSLRSAIPVLTPRENDIAGCVVAGGTSKEIAREMGISPRTVESYRRRLLTKLGARGQSQLVSKLLNAGIEPRGVAKSTPPRISNSTAGTS